MNGYIYFPNIEWDAIRIEGNSGVKGQTLQKDSNNKLNPL